jgi:hypothetical protein
MNTLLSIEDTARLIESGTVLALAGSRRALAQLPAGAWVGGTSHYFIGTDGGVKTDDLIFVTSLSDLGQVNLVVYPAAEVTRLAAEAPANGFSLAIVPAGSDALKTFAQRGYSSDLFLKPVIGWVAGVDLAAIKTTRACVIDGRAGTFHEDAVVVAHVTLPDDKIASISILNPFAARDEHIIRFDTQSFSTETCTVNGERRRLAEFLQAEDYADGRLPLIGDFSGAPINVSIQAVDGASGRVDFYAPVFPGVDYRLAKPIANFAAHFAHEADVFSSKQLAFSCNCILNYLYGDLEGHRLGGVTGPVTFGEIGYQLLNQTMVTLEIV